MDKILGRNIDDNEIEKEMSSDIESMRMLLDRLSSVDQVLDNAALIATLMYSTFNKSKNYNYILFYYVIQKYERLNETMKSIRNYNHVHMEIYSTFVHPKSILYVAVENPELSNQLRESINISTYTTVFAKTGKYLVETLIAPSIEKFRNSVSVGLETYAYEKKVHLDLDPHSELKVLTDVHDFIRNSLVRNQKIRCLPPSSPDGVNHIVFQDLLIKAIFLSLNTQLEYFVKSKSYSYVVRGSITACGNTFLSSFFQCSSKKFKVRGHSFTPYAPVEVVDCSACDLILWGPHPQGLNCNNCNGAIHKDCKEMVKSCLTKRQKLNNKKEFTSQDINDDVELINDSTANKQSEQSINTSHKGSSSRESKPNKIDVPINSDDNNKESSNQSEIKIQTPKSSIKPLRKLQELYSPSMFKEDKLKKSGIIHAKSMNHYERVKVDIDILRSKSTRSHSPDRFDFLYNIPRRIIDKSKSSDSDTENNINISVKPLIYCEWESEEEMKITETFEPEIELKNFPNHNQTSSSKKNPESARLLVLMEFHHKTKFIHMILRRFKYLLVDRWQRMGEFLDLFESLSLKCIEELYTLIKSLVETMDKCKRDDTYDDNIAENVYKWLTDDDDKNLLYWLRLSVDLCCTNVLHSIKASWVEHKRIYSKLNELLSVEFNRLKIIEQLANMRPLLFNLPMIVSKIVNDLNRFPQYQNEALIWKSVQLKLSYLPRFIDERCMPLVKLINEGAVISSMKSNRSNLEIDTDNKFEKFLSNFPKTIFKDHFIDFQLIVISNLRQLHLNESKNMFSSVYTREEIEGAAICYENKMIILQKENDKYLLKQFRSINQQKLLPVISFDQVHVTKQTVKEIKHYSFELTILLINKAILAQILFKVEQIRDMWFDHITKMTKKSQKNDLLLSPNISTLTALADNDKAITHYSTNSLTMASLQNSLGDVSIGFGKAVDLICEDAPNQKEVNEQYKTTFQSGTNTLNEFFFEYLTLLRNYTDIGARIIGKYQEIDPTMLAQRNIVSLHTGEIQNINSKMNNLVNLWQQNPINTIYEEDWRKENPLYKNIDEYLEEIMSSTKEKVVLESTNSSDTSPHKLTRQNAEHEHDN